MPFPSLVLRRSEFLLDKLILAALIPGAKIEPRCEQQHPAQGGNDDSDRQIRGNRRAGPGRDCLRWFSVCASALRWAETGMRPPAAMHSAMLLKAWNSLSLPKCGLDESWQIPPRESFTAAFSVAFAAYAGCAAATDGGSVTASRMAAVEDRSRSNTTCIRER